MSCFMWSLRKLSDVSLQWFGKEVLTLATKANVDAMRKATLDVERFVKKSFTSPGTGKKSRRSGKGGNRLFHRASLPGQPPAIDTGVLRASVNSEVDVKGINVIGRVGSDIDIIKKRASSKGVHIKTQSGLQYGFFLEVGTTNIRARPWLRPALEKMSGHILKVFKRANS